MVSLNELKITGNVVKAPELKSIGDDEESVVVEGRLIHNWSYKKGSENVDRKAVVDFKIYGKQAKRFADSVSTKTNVLLSGNLETDEWTGEDDQMRSRTFLNVRSFQYNSAKES